MLEDKFKDLEIYMEFYIDYLFSIYKSDNIKLFTKQSLVRYIPSIEELSFERTLSIHFNHNGTELTSKNMGVLYKENTALARIEYSFFRGIIFNRSKPEILDEVKMKEYKIDPSMLKVTSVHALN